MTLYDLNMTEDDFDYKLIKKHKTQYKHYSPIIKVDVEVNGIPIQFISKISPEYVQDLSAMGINSEFAFENLIKSQAIDEYINNIKYVRKYKLQNLNKINEI